jgi:hypothetical protein
MFHVMEAQQPFDTEAVVYETFSPSMEKEPHNDSGEDTGGENIVVSPQRNIPDQVAVHCVPDTKPVHGEHDQEEQRGRNDLQEIAQRDFVKYEVFDLLRE